MPSWKDQHQLAAGVDGKKLIAWSGDSSSIANQHTSCAGFHEDVLGMQGALFDLAGEALGVFVSEKAAAGVVDFGDMLAQARDGPRTGPPCRTRCARGSTSSSSTSSRTPPRSSSRS